MKCKKRLTALQVSHFNSTARLNVFLPSFLNSYVRRLPTERTQGERMNGRVGWRGGEVGNWDMKKRGERINHQVRRTTPPDWKNSRGFSLLLSPFPLSYLCISPIALPFFPLLFSYSVISLRSAEI